MRVEHTDIPVDLHAFFNEGEGLESFATKTRGKKAALKYIKKLLKKHGRAVDTSRTSRVMAAFLKADPKLLGAIGRGLGRGR